jgi:hypothetical protein
MMPITQAGKVNCIPVAMPYVDSLFMPRELGDRPDVIPAGNILDCEQNRTLGALLYRYQINYKLPFERF